MPSTLHNRDSIQDYDAAGHGYSYHRQSDPAVAAQIHRALGAARRVLNIGAGSGSYEPTDRHVVAVEPSATMRAQRPAHLPPAVRGTADQIPFDDGAFDAAMAILTIHHWPDLAAGLREVRRVTRGPIVVMTFDPSAETEFWLADYVPEMRDVELRRYPTADVVSEAIGEPCDLIPVAVRRDCPDGFQAALYARPEAFLQDAVRAAQSAWAYLPDGAEARGMARLAAELASGAWDEKYGHLREQAEIRCQLRLLVFGGEP